MRKTVGEFFGSVSEQYPCGCTIEKDSLIMTFTHHDLFDLEYLVSEMKKDAISKLQKHERGEV